MKNLFVPYELAIKAKEFGFDEPCLGVFKSNGVLVGVNHTGVAFNKDAINSKLSALIAAPLYQQLVDWFREKHALEISVKSWKEDGDTGNIIWIPSVKKVPQPSTFNFDFKKETYYDALKIAFEKAFELIKVNNQ